MTILVLAHAHRHMVVLVAVRLLQLLVLARRALRGRAFALRLQRDRPLLANVLPQPADEHAVVPDYL